MRVHPATRTADPPASLIEEIHILLVGSPSSVVLRLIDLSNVCSICASMGELLDGLVRWLKPRSIIEFGAGRSSAVLAAALQDCGGGRLTCIDHDPDYLAPFWS